MEYQIDLREAFNHKMIGEPQDYQERSDIEWGSAECMFLPDSVPSNYDYQGILFDLSAKNNFNADNIQCENQIIQVGLSNLKFIYLLTFSEWIHVNEELQFRYEDGFTQTECITVFEGDKAIWNTDIKKGTCERAFQVKISYGPNYWIYINKIQLKCSQKLTSILLPFNPGLHILAITCKGE